MTDGDGLFLSIPATGSGAGNDFRVPAHRICYISVTNDSERRCYLRAAEVPADGRVRGLAVETGP